MLISKATVEDSSAIVKLLKLSLGESLLPKSKEYWHWKHYQNPFGTSEVLLAKDNDELVGVRAFMKWDWINEFTSIRAVRAVDTATHPQYQGKGIFTKLTMAAVDCCRENGTDIVFNTPNKRSLPGYLKMGWVTSGKMPLLIQVGSLHPQIFSTAAEEQLLKKYPPAYILELMPEDFPGNKQYFQTPLTKAYLYWRYAACPVVKYGAKGQSGEAIVFFRLKKISSGFELRICDVWKHPEGSQNIIRNIIKALVKEIRPVVVTTAPSHVMGSRGIYLKLPAGPLTTVRSLAKENLSDFIKFKNWQPSIGSMELF